jgi:hypothetical protein
MTSSYDAGFWDHRYGGAGGAFILECYPPAQLAHHTGGPREAALLPTLAGLRPELPELEFLHGVELERDIIEGDGHTGRGPGGGVRHRGGRRNGSG